MALIASLVTIAALTGDAPNPFALWTFVVLFFARISAKLNVYLGVPNINVEFLPAPVRHLASHFRISPMNAFFPVGVTAIILALGCWLERALAQDPGSGAHIGFALPRDADRTGAGRALADGASPARRQDSGAGSIATRPDATPQDQVRFCVEDAR